MSVITLQDNNLDAEVYLVSVDRKTGESEYIAIDLASVSYFEIRDDLINFGLTGNITFPNWGEFLNKLKLGGSTIKNGDQYIAIQVYDMDLPGETFVNNGYKFLASAKSSASLMSNVVDIKQSFEIEEDLTSVLKKIGWEVFVQGKGQGISDSGPITAILSNILTLATDNRYSVSESLISRGTTVGPRIGQRNGPLPGSIDVPIGAVEFLKGKISVDAIDNSSSIYELIQNMYNHIVFGGAIGAPRYANTHLPLLKTTYIDADKDKPSGRYLEFNELLTPRHVEFIAKYQTGTSSDFSDVYMEEFAIAPADSKNPNISNHNIIEDYNYVEPDINNLRQTLWGSYTYIDQPDTERVTTTPTKTFNYFKAIFEEGVLGKTKSNLPFIKTDEQKLFKRKSFAKPKDGHDPHIYTKEKDLNLMLKSFIYLNETIVFNVKGKMYRKPGKFITIKGAISPSRVEEIWFVTNVRHKFENGYYENEITAVRFLADGDPSALSDLQREGLNDFGVTSLAGVPGMNQLASLLDEAKKAARQAEATRAKDALAAKAAKEEADAKAAAEKAKRDEALKKRMDDLSQRSD